MATRVTMTKRLKRTANAMYGSFPFALSSTAGQNMNRKLNIASCQKAAVMDDGWPAPQALSRA